MNITDPVVRRYLSALPEPELPDTVWPRVRRVYRQRGQGRGAGWLAVAASAAGLGLLLAIQGTPSVIPEVPGPRVEATAPERDAQLKAVDEAILRGYARGAGAAELAPLWRARQSLVSDGRMLLANGPVRL